MIRAWFWDNWWPGSILATGLYVSDYACTLLGARAYRTRASATLVFEGSYELNPVFQRDIDAAKRLSPRFLLALVSVNVLLALMWWLTHQPPQRPTAYELALGAFVLLELAIHMRHFRNMYLFNTAFGPGGIQGSVLYPRSVSLRLSAFDALSFSLLYLVLFVATGSSFILGGVASCLVLVLKHRYLVGNLRRSAG